MILKSAKIKIDRAIKETWMKNIHNDYVYDHLLKEDTLKSSFYYHIRRKLGTKFLEDNNIRIFTEFCNGQLQGAGRIVDMAIVELLGDSNGYLGDRIKSIIALIEFKYGGAGMNDDNFYGDIRKVKDYINGLGIDCLYYLGFIIEKEYSSPDWLDGRQTNNWAKKKVAVLSANKKINGNGKLQFFIQSCNGLNKDLDT